ncbi:arginyl-tRNA synthetase [Anaerocolumna jejuensis DSM 15929]|uniref:Arginine--tRNA ligase n=1 Tax=Anaerocolumna jejuensis DSM 15929 TaxID=1121322 RepID=A0A1M7D1G9_9FIRM|nr:arginine--tRNA ligase [Anaerocolumna jejuensis]SHL73346.1 arginyl-tRNA synthetase [Anaerocolumna jejuensis DSM 15929]
MKEIIGELLEKEINKLYGVSLEGVRKIIEIPADGKMGDFSLPCFQLAKQLKKNPKLIAEELKERLSEDIGSEGKECESKENKGKECEGKESESKQSKGKDNEGKDNEDKESKRKENESKDRDSIDKESKGQENKDKETEYISKVEAVNGYLNIFMNREIFIGKILREASGKEYGSADTGKGKTICMDYSSPNIAKNFHVGHLRTTIIGNSLYKLYSKLGYSVVRINHLGDWGTQFGKQIVAYKNWSSKEQVEEGGIAELLRVYIIFDREAEKNPALQEEARAWFAKMEQGDEEALILWKWFKEISLKEFERVYKLLNIEFDSYCGESFYMDKVPALVEELKEKRLLEESDGAGIIKLDDYHMPPCLITKKDGSSIYHSRDIAAALYRKETYDFSQCLYITGAEQKLHFAQIFKALEVMGYEWAEYMHHIPYGLVSMGGEKLSTRKGNVIYAEDILKEAVSLALTAIEEKNPNITEKEETAKKIGIGAVIYHDLANQLIKDVSFRWEEVLNFDGMSAPYIQYTYARAGSILRKIGREIEEQKVNTEYLKDDTSYELVKLVGQYPEVVREAAEKYEPSILARYAYSLAVQFNKFYQECRILTAEAGYQEARAFLCKVVQKTIKDAMSLLGIECPEEM